MSVRIVELGCPGHFIAASSCGWRRHTSVIGPERSFRISSVGDYYPPHGTGRETIGSGENDFFETTVFKTNGIPVEGNEDCGCLRVISWTEVVGQRYATAGEAQAGHEAMVARYAAESGRTQ